MRKIRKAHMMGPTGFELARVKLMLDVAIHRVHCASALFHFNSHQAWSAVTVLYRYRVILKAVAFRVMPEDANKA